MTFQQNKLAQFCKKDYDSHFFQCSFLFKKSFKNEILIKKIPSNQHHQFTDGPLIPYLWKNSSLLSIFSCQRPWRFAIHLSECFSLISLIKVSVALIKMEFLSFCRIELACYVEKLY